MQQKMVWTLLYSKTGLLPKDWGANRTSAPSFLFFFDMNEDSVFMDWTLYISNNGAIYSCSSFNRCWIDSTGKIILFCPYQKEDPNDSSISSSK